MVFKDFFPVLLFHFSLQSHLLRVSDFSVSLDKKCTKFTFSSFFFCSIQYFIIIFRYQVALPRNSNITLTTKKQRGERCEFNASRLKRLNQTWGDFRTIWTLIFMTESIQIIFPHAGRQKTKTWGGLEIGSSVENTRGNRLKNYANPLVLSWWRARMTIAGIEPVNSQSHVVVSDAPRLPRGPFALQHVCQNFLPNSMNCQFVSASVSPRGEKKQKLQQLSQLVNKIDCRKQTLVWTLIFLFSSSMKVLMFNRSSYKCASEAGYPEYISRRLLTSLARSCLSFLLLCASCDPPLTM